MYSTSSLQHGSGKELPACSLQLVMASEGAEGVDFSANALLCKYYVILR